MSASPILSMDLSCAKADAARLLDSLTKAWALQVHAPRHTEDEISALLKEAGASLASLNLMAGRIRLGEPPEIQSLRKLIDADMPGVARINGNDRLRAKPALSVVGTDGPGDAA